VAKGNRCWAAEPIPRELLKLGVLLTKTTIQNHSPGVRGLRRSNRTWATLLFLAIVGVCDSTDSRTREVQHITAGSQMDGIFDWHRRCASHYTPVSLVWDPSVSIV
jgi:hypothetical protein